MLALFGCEGRGEPFGGYLDVTEVKVIVGGAPGQHCGHVVRGTSITAAGRIIASLLVASFQLLSGSDIFWEVLFTLLSFSLHLRHVSEFLVFNLDWITSDLFSSSQ